MSVINHRNIQTITTATTLDVNDMGEIIMNAASAIDVIIPDAANYKGLWYRFINVNATVTVKNTSGDTISTLPQNSSVLMMSDDVTWILSLVDNTTLNNHIATTVSTSGGIHGFEISTTPVANQFLKYDPITNTHIYSEATGSGLGDMMRNEYDTNLDYKVNSADVADLALSVSWLNVTSTPVEYPPSTHTHTGVYEPYKNIVKTVYLADWDSTISYQTGDACYYNGKFYKSLIDNNTNNTPPVSEDSNWKNISMGGGVGVDGIYTGSPLLVQESIECTPLTVYNPISINETSSLIFASTPVMMLNFNDGNFSRMITDSRTNYQKYARTYNNACTIGQISDFSTGSIYYDGTGDYITYTDHSDFEFSNGDFTIEMFIYLNSKITALRYLYNKQTSKTSAASISVYFAYSSGTVSLNTSYSTNGTSSTTYTTNITELELRRWYHVSVVRNGANLMHFIDGTQQGSSHNIGVSTLNNSTANMIIGADGAGSNAFMGWMDEIRVSKIARYTADGSTPTSEFISDENTSLLLHGNESHGSTIFVDSGNTGHSATPNGNVHTWGSPAKYGTHCLWLNGSTDYITIADSEDFNFGANNFTIDCWFSLRSLPSSGSYFCIFSHRYSATSNHAIACYVYNNAGSYYIQFCHSYNGSTITTTNWSISTPSVLTWYHIAIVRNGTNIDGYLNGNSIGTIAVSTNSIFNTTYSFSIGASLNTGSYNNYFNGWIDCFRIVKNQALWTSSFTSPTDEFEY